MKKIFLIVFGICLSIILSSVDIYACSCAYSSPATAFNKVKSVFIGKMIGGTEKFTVEYENGNETELEAGVVKFQTIESFKGDIPQEVAIDVYSMRGTSCGPYGLVKGQTYIVYAYEYTGEDGRKSLSSGVCTRTDQIDRETVKNEDLKFLRNLPPVGTGGNLDGNIWIDFLELPFEGNRSPQPNIKIQITGEDGKTETVVSDKDGRFKVVKIKAGKYKVEPILPDYLYFDDLYNENEFREIEVSDLGTAQVGFAAYYKGKISGNVFDINGVNYNSGSIKLESIGKPERQAYGHSDDEKGNFSVEGIPPGNYILYFELDHKDYKKNQKYYYPGTFNKTKAKVIKVGLAEQIKGIKFPLPKEYQIVTIEGQVLLADGKPARKEEVLLLCPETSNPNGLMIDSSAVSAKTDENGKFLIQGFKGISYWLESRSKNGEDYKHSPLKKITLESNLKDVKLVLSEDGRSAECGEKPTGNELIKRP